MRNYLSFGGGVNSVALYLYLIDQGVDFEAVFVDHGTDWPETYEYFRMFQGWIITRGLPRITVLTPIVQGSNNLYDHCWKHQMVPSFMNRWCTDKFKRTVLNKYQKPPAFVFIGYSYDEAHRAKITSLKGLEFRWPLIEAEITREGCIGIIKSHGLPIPMKSGCYICPFQRKAQWIELRRKHPDLFCKAEALENRNIAYRIERGKSPLFLSMSKKSLKSVVSEYQTNLFEEDNYPPCQCGL